MSPSPSPKPRRDIPLGHTIPAHQTFGWCSYCPGHSPAEELAAWQTREPIDSTKPDPAATGAVGIDELAHALDNSTPYPIELDNDLCRFMAARLLEMVTVAKKPEHEVWQPQEQPAPAPEPLDPSVVFSDGA
ncbi:hypothetical protein [Streptomyces sp. ISBFB 2968]|uniref:hypothetical protein n=1 Tax=Streptomyces sp. ISBFB 2968 TaxID=2903527 RepID=UPI002FDC1BA3